MTAFLKKPAAIILIGLVLTGPIGCFQACAHGVGYRQSKLPAVPLEFFYSTGDTMSYLETKIFSPADEKFANQSGRTDATGRFAFVPDVAGKWRVIVKDDEGHRCMAEINVTQKFLDSSSETPSCLAIAEHPAAPQGMDLALRGAFGVSLLFNAAAFVLLARRRKAA